jgi:hypothetical protein
MNPETFDIAKFETQRLAEEAGYTVPLTEKEATHLGPMNRHQRRAWLVQKRKADRRAAKAARGHL